MNCRPATLFDSGHTALAANGSSCTTNPRTSRDCHQILRNAACLPTAPEEAGVDSPRALVTLSSHKYPEDFEMEVLEDFEAPAPQLQYLLAANCHVVLEDFEAPAPQLRHSLASHFQKQVAHLWNRDMAAYSLFAAAPAICLWSFPVSSAVAPGIQMLGHSARQ